MTDPVSTEQPASERTVWQNMQNLAWWGTRWGRVLALLRAHPLRSAIASIVIVLVCAVGVWLAILLSPPESFSTVALVEVPSEGGTPAIASALVAQNVIRSERAFTVAARLSGAHTGLQAGTYNFSEPLGTLGVLRRIAAGQFGIEQVRVTIPEGYTVREIADTLALELPGFNRDAFLTLASTSEGYLFPETYFFMPGDAEEDIIVRMRAQFSAEITPITTQILSSGRSMEDIVIMASLLEREAVTLEDKRIIAGILWERIDIDMPLQVDAVFAYILGVKSHHPSFEDLEMDSPYNTYENTGLPPTPIANPGLNALTAAVTPIQTDYLFYLTGRDGNMYYARTFDEHRENRRLYLD